MSDALLAGISIGISIGLLLSFLAKVVMMWAV